MLKLDAHSCQKCLHTLDSSFTNDWTLEFVIFQCHHFAAVWAHQ